MIYNTILEYTKIFILFTMSVFLILSCRGIEPEHFEIVQALPVNDTLAARTINIPNDIELLNPYHIINIDDNYLIIADQKEEKIFSVFSLPNLELLYTWGQMGQGPDEFHFPPAVEINVKNDELIMFDPVFNKLSFYTVNDTALLKTQELSLEYSEQINPLNRVRRISDSLYISDCGVADKSTNHEHIALRPGESNPLFLFGRYPKTNLEHSEKYFKYIKSNTAKPNQSKFASFYLYNNIFKIYDTKGQELKSIQINDPLLPDDSNYRDEFRYKDEFQYRAVNWSSDNYMYTLGLNVTEEEYLNDSFRPSIEIWDWDGQPLYRAMFDKPIHNFTVSEKHRKIYAYSSLESHEIYEYDLSEILKKIIGFLP